MKKPKQRVAKKVEERKVLHKGKKINSNDDLFTMSLMNANKFEVFKTNNRNARKFSEKIFFGNDPTESKDDGRSYHRAPKLGSINNSRKIFGKFQSDATTAHGQKVNLKSLFEESKNTREWKQQEKREREEKSPETVVNSDESSNSEFEFLEAECEMSDDDVDVGENDDNVDDDERELFINDGNEKNYYILTPIQENSEPSSCDTHYCNNDESDGNSHHHHHHHPDDDVDDGYMMMTSSLYAVSAVREDEDPLTKSQTFPRSKIPASARRHRLRHDYDDSGLYPFEPRILDPSGFHQLHAADSQEELQEFLLLESECMDDERQGLASAFIPSDSKGSSCCKSKNRFSKGKFSFFSFPLHVSPQVFSCTCLSFFLRFFSLSFLIFH